MSTPTMAVMARKEVEAEWHRQKVEMWADDLSDIQQEIEAEWEQVKLREIFPGNYLLAKGRLLESIAFLRGYLHDLEDDSGSAESA